MGRAAVAKQMLPSLLNHRDKYENVTAAITNTLIR